MCFVFVSNKCIFPFCSFHSQPHIVSCIRSWKWRKRGENVFIQSIDALCSLVSKACTHIVVYIRGAASYVTAFVVLMVSATFFSFIILYITSYIDQHGYTYRRCTDFSSKPLPHGTIYKHCLHHDQLFILIYFKIFCFLSSPHTFFQNIFFRIHNDFLALFSSQVCPPFLFSEKREKTSNSSMKLFTNC